MEPTMLLITSPWGGVKTFKLMPINKDCPFGEGIFDSEGKVLVMLSKEKKKSLQLLPKLDDNGDPVKSKTVRPNGKTVKEGRATVETFTEHYIIEPQEIKAFIKMFAINESTFEYAKYLNPADLLLPETPKIEIIKS
jgi:hypothetical protein